MTDFENCKNEASNPEILCILKCKKELDNSYCRCRVKALFPKFVTSRDGTENPLREILEFETNGQRTLIQKCLENNLEDSNIAAFYCTNKRDENAKTFKTMCETTDTDLRTIEDNITDVPALNAFLQPKFSFDTQTEVKPVSTEVTLNSAPETLPLELNTTFSDSLMASNSSYQIFRRKIRDLSANVSSSNPFPPNNQNPILRQKIDALSVNVPSLNQFPTNNDYILPFSHIRVFFASLFVFLFIFFNIIGLIIHLRKKKSNKRQVALSMEELCSVWN